MSEAATTVRAVALGGGHGLAASLSALRRVVADPTAVVTVADNGGSSGRLRAEFGVLPPGDLRMALAALCGDDEWGRTWARVLQHRFEGEGPLRGHALGNLLILSLWELLDGHVQGLDWVAGLLGARGRVLPMCAVPLDITARVRGLDPDDPTRVASVRGQAEVASTLGEIVSVALDPSTPPACPDALEAVRTADWVVLGPGSWFTSVIPHLLVPELRAALEDSPARTVVTLNLEAPPGETGGFSPGDHLAALRTYAPGLGIDAVLVDRRQGAEDARLAAMVESMGAELVVADLAQSPGSHYHDPSRLAEAYTRVIRRA